MIRQTLIAILFSSGIILAQTPTSHPAQVKLAPLFNKIWRITSATPYPHSESIYIFLSNGTLLETSCVETYRVAEWKADPQKPGTIEVTEDGRPAFAATITAATARTLNLHQVMLLGDKAAHVLTLAAIDKEFVCPDLPK